MGACHPPVWAAPIMGHPGPLNVRAAWGPSCGPPVTPSPCTRDLQDIADDPDAPHVCCVANGLVVDHFRCHKLRGAKEDLQRPCILCNQDGEGSIAGTLWSQPIAHGCPHLCAQEGHRQDPLSPWSTAQRRWPPLKQMHQCPSETNQPYLTSDVFMGGPLRPRGSFTACVPSGALRGALACLIMSADIHCAVNPLPAAQTLPT